MAADLDWFAALFLGIKAAVLAIIAQALLRIAGRALKTPIQRVLAVVAFAALFLFDAPFPLVVLAALALGAIGRRRRARTGSRSSPRPRRRRRLPRPWSASIRARARVAGDLGRADGWLVLVFLGPDHVLWDIGVFFSQLAVVTFGGAYAVLAYMAQEAVSGYGWLSGGRDGRRAGPGRDHARSADHGHAVRRLPGRVPRARAVQPAGRRSARRRR